MAEFFAKLEAAVQRNRSLLCVGLDPLPDQVPQRYRVAGQDAASAILTWNLAVIEQTADLVCAYKPNSAFYEALGARGWEVLAATLAAVPADIPTILDAKRGDIGNTAEAYARACFEELQVDAVTLSPYRGADSIHAFARYPGKGLFVLCHTSNPSAGDLQELEIADWRSLDREPNQPLYVHVAQLARQWSPQTALVVGATFPEALARVRAVAPQTWFLVPGIGAQGGDLETTLTAGLRADRSGVIVNSSRAIAGAVDHRQAALATRSAINAVRQQPVASAPPAPRENFHPLRSLVLELADLGAVRFGSFTLASGLQSPIYLDLRLLVSRPSLLARAATAYANLLADLPCERIAGVPYAALPIGTAVAIASDKPLIYPRKEAKEHGLGKQIEGVWHSGERVLLIEDLITSGGSTIKTAETLRAAGLVVEHAIVLIDRQQGGVANLAAAGIQVHAVLTLTQILEILSSAEKITASQFQQVLAFLGQPGRGSAP